MQHSFALRSSCNTSCALRVLDSAARTIRLRQPARRIAACWHLASRLVAIWPSLEYSMKFLTCSRRGYSSGRMSIVILWLFPWSDVPASLRARCSDLPTAPYARTFIAGVFQDSPLGCLRKDFTKVRRSGCFQHNSQLVINQITEHVWKQIDSCVRIADPSTSWRCFL